MLPCLSRTPLGGPVVPGDHQLERDPLDQPVVLQTGIAQPALGAQELGLGVHVVGLLAVVGLDRQGASLDVDLDQRPGHFLVGRPAGAGQQSQGEQADHRDAPHG